MHQGKAVRLIADPELHKVALRVRRGGRAEGRFRQRFVRLVDLDFSTPRQARAGARAVISDADDHGVAVVEVYTLEQQTLALQPDAALVKSHRPGPVPFQENPGRLVTGNGSADADLIATGKYAVGKALRRHSNGLFGDRGLGGQYPRLAVGRGVDVLRHTRVARADGYELRGGVLCREVGRLFKVGFRYGVGGGRGFIMPIRDGAPGFERGEFTPGFYVSLRVFSEGLGVESGVH